jgi:CYTH domain-containing protein
MKKNQKMQLQEIEDRRELRRFQIGKEVTTDKRFSIIYLDESQECT